MSRPQILVVGSMNMDLMVYGVPRLPEYGVSVVCASYAYSLGGKGSNQALAAALQGAAVTLVGRVGEDDYGRTFIRELEKAGVNTDCIVVDSAAQTGLAPIMVNNEGKYVSYGIPGANTNLTEADVRKAFDSRSFDMVVMQLEMPLEVVYRTYEIAAERNIPVFLDAGPAMHIPMDRLRGIFIVSPNEAETEALTGIKTDTDENILKAAQKLYDECSPRFVVLKLGHRGALLYDGTASQFIPGFKVNAIDSTAAGDTFGAALSISLCRGMSMESAVVYANAAAGICVTRKGAQPSIPTEAEVVHFIKEQKEAGEIYV